MSVAAGQVPRRRSPIPVLVFGTGITALGVIRTLGRAGIPSYLISQDPGFSAYSRWYRGLPTGVTALPEPGNLAEWLETLPLDRAVLMPCADDWVQAVAALPASLSQRFPASIASPEVIGAFLDKGRFAKLLQQQRLPHPRTVMLDSPEQLEGFSNGDFAGAFLKPRGSLECCQRYGVKAFRVKDRAEAMRTLRDALNNGVTLMLQEYVPGPPTAHYFIDGFVDRNGRVCARFARRRLRMHPPDFGNSSFHASVPLKEVSGAMDTVDWLWTVLPYRGIFSAEFKYDARDGLFKILEVNVRPWWYIEFAARSGVDVCRLAYRDALGLPVDEVQEYKVGRRCVHPPFDVRAYRRLRREGQLGLWSWVRSWITAEQPVFCWGDPGPGMANLLLTVRGYWRDRKSPWLSKRLRSRRGAERDDITGAPSRPQ